MARASRPLIQAIRATASRLERADTRYRWSHFAHCNCGQLAQTLTGWSPETLYQAAAAERGDWAEQAQAARAAWPDSPAAGPDSPAAWPDSPAADPDSPAAGPDYGDRPALDEGAWQPEDLGACTVSHRRMSELFDILAQWGLSPQDIASLERLEDPIVRRRLGTNTVDFHHSDRKNVVAYLRAWAEVLEAQLSRDEPLTTEQPLPLAAE